MDKKQSFQVGDMLSFQVGISADGTKRAFNLQAINEQPSDQPQPQRIRPGNDLKKGKIDSIRGNVSRNAILSDRSYLKYTKNSIQN